MNEELIKLDIEGGVDIEIIEEDVISTDLEQNVDVAETVEEIDVTVEEDIEIEVEEFVGWTGGDNTRHYSLAGRDEVNQHPIKAITGLREELDDITKLKTLYSDKINIANYYKWNSASYDEYGYFVSLTSDALTIKICDGSDILGVTVDDAGFIGGQSSVVPRDNSYGLIVTSGVVDVRCELDVEIGDYVVSNAYGYATKSNSNYGYRVLEKENKHGVEYAVIMLGIQADIINTLGEELDEVEKRVSVNEANIISAINVANEAYSKANECVVSNKEMSDKVNGALGTVGGLETDMENLGSQVANSTLISAQAKAIAESAVTSAESMRNEAVDRANEALEDTTELRKEFETKVEEIDRELEETILELEATKEDTLAIKEELQQSIEDTKADMNSANDKIKQDIADTQTSLKETQEDILSLQEDIEPLATWPEGSDNPTGIAGFVAKADENSATLGRLVEWQGETDKSIAAFKQEVADNYATQAMLSAVGDNLTLFKQEVSDTYATQEMVSAVDDNLAKYKQEVTDTYATQEMVSSVDDALTSYKQEVSKNYATQQMLSSVEDNITSFKQEVSDTYATQEMVTTVDDNLTSFKQEVKDDYATQEMLTNVDDALTAYKQEVEKNYATQQMLSSVENNLASYKQEVTDTYATQQMLTTVDNNLTSYKQEVDETYATQEMVTKLETDTSKALSDYKQEVKDEYATQEMVTKLETDTSKALTDYKQEVGNTYATQTSLTTLRTDTTKAIAASEEKATATYASKNDLTSFESDTNTAMARIEQKADANGAYIQSTVSNMNKHAVGTYSQSHNFKLDQAKGALTTGTIYVPTETHTESLPSSRTFTKQYYYTWDGEKWVTSSSVAVTFSDSYVIGGGVIYWYIPGANNVTNEGITYNSHTLYKWESSQWVGVATLAGNSQNVAVSQIRQDANSIETAVTTLDGKYAGTKAWVDNNSSNIQDVVSWKSNVESDVSNIATIKQTADNAGASIAQVVEAVGKDGKVTAASIVTAVNDAGSSVVINADHINFEADNYTIHADKIDFEGSQFTSKMSNTYSTKDETNIAKNDAIDIANNNTDEKLKNYSTTAQTQSLIDQKADSITLSVSNTYSTKSETDAAKEAAITEANSSTDDKLKNYSTTTQMNSAIDQKADSITLSVSQTYSTKDDLSGVEKRVTTAESSIKTNADNIESKVSKDGVISSINQSAEAVTIDASKINLNGYVTISNLSTAGETTINGANIITKTISADQINATSLSAISTNIGTISAGIIKSENPASGINIDLNNGTIDMNGFLLDGNGNLTITGKIQAISGYIGSSTSGFTINSKYITNGKTAYNESTNDGVYLGADGIGLGKGKFWVNNEGFLHAESGEFSGIMTGNMTAGIISSENPLSGININLNDGTMSMNGFTLDANGDLIVNKGTIGGFTISDSKLSSETSTVLEFKYGNVVAGALTSTNYVGSSGNYGIAVDGGLKVTKAIETSTKFMVAGESGLFGWFACKKDDGSTVYLKFSGGILVDATNTYDSSTMTSWII